MTGDLCRNRKNVIINFYTSEFEANKICINVNHDLLLSLINVLYNGIAGFVGSNFWYYVFVITECLEVHKIQQADF